MILMPDADPSLLTAACRSSEGDEGKPPAPGAGAPLSELPSQHAVDADCLVAADMLRMARLEATSPLALFSAFLELARLANAHAGYVVESLSAEAREREIEAAFAAHLERDAAWKERLDRRGNPGWISIHLPERKDAEDGAKAKGVLPDEDSAAPPPVTWEEDNEENKPQGLFGRFFRFLTPGARQPEEKDEAQREREGLGYLVPRKTRPMRSFVRMLIVVAFLATAYHFLAKRGWVPPLF